MELLKKFFKEEDGLGTVEIVLIIAVLVALVLIFKSFIMQFMKDIMDSIFGKEGTKVDENTTYTKPK